jgi:hypothetical protein
MKNADANSDLTDQPRERTAEERREGRTRARRIIALAEGGIAGKIGRTDITNMSEDELMERYQRLKRRG